MARVRFRPRAIADLEQIGDFIATDNPAAAATFIAEIMRCCELLAGSPMIGRDRAALRSGTRSFPVGHYIVFYSPASDGIEVVRVLHGARDVQSL
ncbi:type II toxin-antitoxin system RelE/ParE family toxin [Paramagnetospirillum kuznetsovii]|uniref:Type II toxin-antitoxin system RelE/ParE family toxin n=1 Tax=Paramagnetospirillum kuznetsovii TaxID=2053833 RepID=A0A364NXV1_9PROT|nr:type II toxin-antitoxin system RelE/ParE family toxin [Paramagnetospirillum kuznetsovii]RAU21896.1 type II toxin-antitoxin system RelE/ParE family toxin [Paramagnetospirillum kuznetsovii]